jgi:hypothetical protein
MAAAITSMTNQVITILGKIQMLPYNRHLDVIRLCRTSGFRSFATRRLVQIQLWKKVIKTGPEDDR